MRIRLNRAAAVAVRRGAPWVYRDALGGRDNPPLHPGDAVELSDETGAFLAHAYADPASAIALRVTSRKKDERFSAALLGARVRAAIARRDGMFDEADTNAMRLCNGEGDGAPGIVIDRYAHVAVVRLDTDAIHSAIEDAADGIAKQLAARGVTSLALHAGRDRDARESAATKLASLRGEAAPARVVVLERGVKMEVDLARGQKTGAFLDQRENRARVRRLSRGRVLNMFSYAGGFSIAAALGGATHVTSVDLAGAAHATAERTFRENGVDAKAHAFVAADAFAFLDKARAAGERFDVVISDPPSFAPSEKALPRAIAAYRKLHAACAAVLAKDGVYCASSCSSHVDAEAFLATLDAEALGRDDLRVLEVHGQPADHPTTPGWPEGRYLKFVVLG